MPKVVTRKEMAALAVALEDALTWDDDHQNFCRTLEERLRLWGVPLDSDRHGTIRWQGVHEYTSDYDGTQRWALFYESSDGSRRYSGVHDYPTQEQAQRALEEPR